MAKRKCWQLVALLLSSLFIFTQNSFATNIDKIVVFGDSLSDNGNIYSLTKSLNKLGHLVPIIPKNPPYYEGRFSNGLNWVDHLSTSMNVKLDDYAYGGAWVESLWKAGLLIPFNMGMQVNYYLINEAADFHKDNHLYVIWGGANDYIHGRDNVDEATTTTVKVIKDQIDWLVYYGAKNFLIPTIPDISRTPEVVQQGDALVAQTKKLVVMHNAKLAEMIAEEKKAHPELKFVMADVETNFTDLMDHPGKYNLKNVTDACYGGGYYFNLKMANLAEVKAAKAANLDLENNDSLRVAYYTSKLAERGQPACDEPDSYLFWDQIHPTRVIHQVIAVLAQTDLAVNDIYGKAKS